MNQVGVVFLLITLLVVACKEDDTAPVFNNLGIQYLPLEVGQESIYQVDSIKYNQFTGRVDTIRLQLREVVRDSLFDAEQRKAFDVGVYQRANDTSIWRLIRIIRKTRIKSRYELLDNNQKLVPLVFPVEIDKEWDVNSLNASSTVEYSYQSINERFKSNGIDYDSTLTVSQLDEENRIERRFAEEKYAVGFGLIYRRAIDVETNFDGQIISGYDVSLELISFSK